MAFEKYKPLGLFSEFYVINFFAAVLVFVSVVVAYDPK